MKHFTINFILGILVLLALATGSHSVAQAAQIPIVMMDSSLTSGQNLLCGWIDGQDSRIPIDQGRGVLDWNAHYDHVLTAPTGMTNPAGAVSSRIFTLIYCMRQARVAKAYADASVIMARYGRTYCDWVDGQDPNWTLDPGRGVSDWTAHYSYVINTPDGMSVIVDAFGTRMSTLRMCLAQTDFASVYADVSVVLAEYGRNN